MSQPAPSDAEALVLELVDLLTACDEDAPLRVHCYSHALLADLESRGYMKRLDNGACVFKPSHIRTYALPGFLRRAGWL